MRASLIIHIYALLHAASAIVCRLLGVPDEYVLTLLTIMMIVQICLRKQKSLNVINCAIAFGNLAGYLLGTVIAMVIAKTGMPEMGIYSLSTFITTEAVGWTILALSRLFSQETSRDRVTRTWTVIAILGVYLTRIALSLCYRKGVFNISRGTEEVLYFLSSFCVMTLLVVLVMVGYEIVERRNVRKEKEKRHLAQFRYLKLSQQVNPHFLFNSLNVLDCLVNDGESEKASEYIRKLSGIYRYMLGHEEQVLVKLGDEIEFTRQYVDLMMLRFPQGLTVNFELDDEALKMCTVPCAVQLLIENATKHNAIDRRNPLTIEVSASSSEKWLRVSNNLCPKLSPVNSTGKGLKYIKQQFLDISGKEILIEQDEMNYTVTLPLL